MLLKYLVKQNVICCRKAQQKYFTDYFTNFYKTSIIYAGN